MTKRTTGDHELHPRGFYPTPRAAFEPLSRAWRPGALRVGDPMAGDGALCVHMADAGWSVTWASDIHPQHPHVMEYNALDLLAGPDVWVTNPPWPVRAGKGEPTKSLLTHLSDLRPTWALLPSDWMHNVTSADLLRRCRAIVTVGRVQWIPDSAGPGFDNCAWYLFDTWNYLDGHEIEIANGWRIEPTALVTLYGRK